MEILSLTLRAQTFGSCSLNCGVTKKPYFFLIPITKNGLFLFQLLSSIQEGSLFHLYHCFPLSNHLSCGRRALLKYIQICTYTCFSIKKLDGEKSYFPYVGTSILKIYLKNKNIFNSILIKQVVYMIFSSSLFMYTQIISQISFTVLHQLLVSFTEDLTYFTKYELFQFFICALFIYLHILFYYDLIVFALSLVILHAFIFCEVGLNS